MKVRRVSRRDWAKEYLGLEIAIKLVTGIEEAIDPHPRLQLRA
jgi:glutamate-5-semialdehyde dehydrogenase